MHKMATGSAAKRLEGVQRPRTTIRKLPSLGHPAWMMLTKSSARKLDHDATGSFISTLQKRPTGPVAAGDCAAHVDGLDAAGTRPDIQVGQRLAAVSRGRDDTDLPSWTAGRHGSPLSRHASSDLRITRGGMNVTATWGSKLARRCLPRTRKRWLKTDRGRSSERDGLPPSPTPCNWKRCRHQWRRSWRRSGSGFV